MGTRHSVIIFGAAALLALPAECGFPPARAASSVEAGARAGREAGIAVPRPAPAIRPSPPAPKPPGQTAGGRQERARLLWRVRSWAAQMQNLDVGEAKSAAVDLIVADASSGAAGGGALTAEDVTALKTRPDGSRRLAISYLSIGEAEDYRSDYFNSEYMTEDAPDWLLAENQKWKGNRLIRFCEEGWQRTILGDEQGRNLYNSVEPSPLYRLIELGFDGVYLDRADVYSEVAKQCPDAARKMVEFVVRLAAHARKKNPNFIVILQNAEELLEYKAMIEAIDAVAKEDLFYGADHSERENPASMVEPVLRHLALAKAAGRPVFVLDYLHDPAKRAADKAKIEAQGFIPYFGPRKLDKLWFSHAAP